MYRVLGADGKEYGPVNGEVLGQRIADGRAHAETRVPLEGGSEWQTLGSVEEVEAFFPPAPAAAVVVEARGEVKRNLEGDLLKNKGKKGTLCIRL